MISLKQSVKDVNGIRTEIVLQPFADRILVLVTQLGKVGNLIQVSIPHTASFAPFLPADSTEANAPSFPPPPLSIQLTPLLGDAPTEHLRTLHALYASQIATIIWTAEAEGLMDSNKRSVIVGLALRRTGDSDSERCTEQERESFHGIMRMVTELIV